ncbi:sodium:proton antiporter [Elusimicrobiota bacterium]
MIEYFLCMILFSIGLYGVFAKRNILKIILGIAIMGYAIDMIFVLAGYKTDGEIPILKPGLTVFVDPLVQAMVLTTILISLALIIFLLVLAMRIYEKYGTLNISEIKKLKG